MARKGRLPLLVVDGYNVVHTPHYAAMIDEHAGAGALADVAHLSRDPYGHDPFERAREALAVDVAAYAKGDYEAVVVFDAADNLSDERPETSVAGVRTVYSATGESADTVIERLVTRARRAGRDVLLVTSDNTIRFTVGGVPVTTVSSQLLAKNLEVTGTEIERVRRERTGPGHMTLAERVDADTLARLREMLGQ